MQHCFLLSWKSLRFLGSAMGIVIANHKNRCDFGALSSRLRIFNFAIFEPFGLRSPGKEFQQVRNPTPLNPTPATGHKRKQKLRCNFRKVALQKSHCSIRFSASADFILTKSCAATYEKLHCNIGKAALQESGASLPLSCGFQAPTFSLPHSGPAEHSNITRNRQES